MHRLRRLTFAILLAIGLAQLPAIIVSAQSVVQSYGSSSPLQTGLIVQQDSKNSNKVEISSQSNASKMFGVVVNPGDSPVTLSGNSSNQAFVATSGNYDVLVGDQNGSIKTGDYVTISSLDGIGMKATSGDSYVLGRATGTFTGSGSTASTTLKNSGGQSTTVHLGQVAVNIAIGRNPLAKNQQNNLPGFLRSAGQSVANKSVSTARLYISMVVLAASAIIAGSLLYAGVRSSVTAIGRNPLSKKSVIRSLVQVTLTSLIVFIIGLFAVYLLLKL